MGSADIESLKKYSAYFLSMYLYFFSVESNHLSFSINLEGNSIILPFCIFDFIPCCIISIEN